MKNRSLHNKSLVLFAAPTETEARQIANIISLMHYKWWGCLDVSPLREPLRVKTEHFELEMKYAISTSDRELMEIGRGYVMPALRNFKLFPPWLGYVLAFLY